jgi:hypothetical protein
MPERPHVKALAPAAHATSANVGTADYYRKLADEALRLARLADTPEARSTIEEIAYTWSRLAREHRAGSLAGAASMNGRPQGATD